MHFQSIPNLTFLNVFSLCILIFLLSCGKYQSTQVDPSSQGVRQLFLTAVSGLPSPEVVHQIATSKSPETVRLLVLIVNAPNTESGNRDAAIDELSRLGTPDALESIGELFGPTSRSRHPFARYRNAEKFALFGSLHQGGFVLPLSRLSGRGGIARSTSQRVSATDPRRRSSKSNFRPQHRFDAAQTRCHQNSWFRLWLGISRTVTLLVGNCRTTSIAGVLRSFASV
jgi:hypothetical protein